MIECVPNISEGRDQRVLDAVSDELTKVPGLQLLHIDPGVDANRTVLTMCGADHALTEGALRLVKLIQERLDMRRHAGVHPCLGAVDVCPFVPLGDSPMSRCIELARVSAERIGKECRIPVYLYEHAAQREERKSLSYVRGKGYRTLKHRLTEPRWQPDYGPTEFDERFGALICGARNILVAFNVNLRPSSTDLADARTIAERIREAGPEGGRRLPGLRAIGWYLESFRLAQVSMNLLDFSHTGLFEAYEACRLEAEALGAELAGSELVGMIPKRALLDAGIQVTDLQAAHSEAELINSAVQYLGLSALKPFKAEERILELRLGCPDADLSRRTAD